MIFRGIYLVFLAVGIRIRICRFLVCGFIAIERMFRLKLLSRFPPYSDSSLQINASCFSFYVIHVLSLSIDVRTERLSQPSVQPRIKKYFGGVYGQNIIYDFSAFVCFSTLALVQFTLCSSGGCAVTAGRLPGPRSQSTSQLRKPAR